MQYRYIVGAERELARTLTIRVLRDVLSDFPECADLNLAHYLTGDIPYVSDVLMWSFMKSTSAELGAFWKADLANIKRYAAQVTAVVDEREGSAVLTYLLPADDRRLKAEADQVLLYLGLIKKGLPKVKPVVSSPDRKLVGHEADLEILLWVGKLLYQTAANRFSEKNERRTERELRSMAEHFEPWVDVLSHVPEHEAFGRMCFNE